MRSFYIVEKSGEIIFNLIFYSLFLILFKFILNMIVTDTVDSPSYYGTAISIFLFFEVRKYRVWVRENKKESNQSK